MMADAPRDTGERLAAHEERLGWIKKIGGYMIAVTAAGFVALFCMLYSLNANVAGMAAKLDVRLDAQDAKLAAMDAKLDKVLAAVTALAGN